MYVCKFNLWNERRKTELQTNKLLLWFASGGETILCFFKFFIMIIIIFKSFERLSGLDMHDGTLSGAMGHRDYGIAAAGKDKGERMALPDSILDR